MSFDSTVYTNPISVSDNVHNAQSVVASEISIDELSNISSAPQDDCNTPAGNPLLPGWNPGGALLMRC